MGIAMERDVRFGYLSEIKSDGEIVGGFCAPVRAWWEGRFKEMSRPQRMAVPAIARGEHTLICTDGDREDALRVYQHFE